MMPLLLAVTLLLAGAVAGGADVYFVEQIVNPGSGKKKTGARKTINKVYIKGKRQKVESNIETSAKTAKALRKQGKSLNSSKILQLDASQIYEIDLEAHTFVQQKMPPAAKKATPKATGAGPQIDFAFKEPGDTTRIAGILCTRVVSQMRARYLNPKTKKPRKENRYTYDAWIARDFPGYKEIKAFRALQEAQTSYPPLISGGLEQLTGAVENYERLGDELDALEGFPMRSTIRVTVVRPGKKGEMEVFRLEREIKTLNYSPLPDSVFTVSRTMTRVKVK